MSCDNDNATDGSFVPGSRRRDYAKFAAVVAASYLTGTAALSLVTLVALTQVGSDWSMRDQRLAAGVTLLGAAVAMLVPTGFVTVRQIRRARRIGEPGVRQQDVGEIIAAYCIATLALGVLAFVIIIPQRDRLRAPTWHQAQAEIAAERYLSIHHEEIASRAFAYAFDEVAVPLGLRDEIAASLLSKREGARCSAPQSWLESGVMCSQNYYVAGPIRFSIAAPIYVEMAGSSFSDAPVAVSAHVQVAGIFVDAMDEEEWRRSSRGLVESTSPASFLQGPAPLCLHLRA